MCICIYLCPWELLREQSFFFLECYIFIFCLFSGSENYFKEVTDALSNYTHPKSRFVFTSSGGVFTGRNYILHNILLSSLNNCPAVIIISLHLFFNKKFYGNVKVQIFDISYMYKYTNASTFLCGLYYYILYMRNHV